MTQKLILAFNFLIVCFLSVSWQTTSLHHHHHRRGHHHAVFRPRKLFVIGDSYADTGNTPKAFSSAWKAPYGMTFPGKPSGRFSDGRVLPDFVAKYYGLRSPIPYKFRRSGAKHARRYGMNFAIGGTGVFDTLVPLPNMTAQIDMLQQLTGVGGTYTAADLRSSLALVTLSGNDYSAYLATNGTFEALPTFIEHVVDQLKINIKRIHGLGLKKVAVAGLPPLGCLPYLTNLGSPRKCVELINSFVDIHNQLLTRAVAGLNNETGNSTTFAVVDLYDSFMSAIDSKGNSMWNDPLEPCCVGVNGSYSCGDMDPSGAKMYRVCPRPGSAFFWDMVHPTQRGWKVVYASLASTFRHL